jgi:tetratricopeptide (TPR) repeat protein
MGDYFYHGILDYDSALKEYNEALRLNPNDVDANNGIAFVLRRQGKMSEAITFLEKSFTLDPRNFNSVFSIGETYCILREYERGRPFLDKIILLTPEAVTPYDLKARSYLLGSGDTKKARNIILSAYERKIGLDSERLKVVIYLCDILDGDLDAALVQINGIKEYDEQFMYIPEDLYIAKIYRLKKNTTLAEKHFNSAIKVLQDKIKLNPEDSRLYSSLGLAYAGLGKKEEAIQNGKHGYELLPISREAWRGTFRLLDLAQIYTMAGEQDLALDAIEDLLKRPTDAISVWLLKLDPTWNPLRVNPRFQKISEKYK